MKRCLGVAILIGLVSAPAFAACSRTDFKILQADWGVAGLPNFYNVIGEVQNNCAKASDVELQFTFRDTNGRVIAVDKENVAPTRNIMSGEKMPFQFLVNVNTGRPDKMEATVFNVE